MATEYRAFSVTVPAGTPQATPAVTDLPMPARIVRSVRLRFPPGPQSTVGVALGAAGVQVIPYNAGGWVIGNDEVIDWPLDGQIDSGAWQLFGYNLGSYAHTIYLAFALDLVPSTPGAATLGLPLTITPG